MSFSRNFYSTVVCAVFLFISSNSCCWALQDAPITLSDDNEFTAIKFIHRQLDDNADGSVDFKESEEFVQTELCGIKEKKMICLDSEKSLKFHLTDTEITSTELWDTWHQNEVFSWTTEDVVDWLEHSVKLPQYSSNFVRQKITGRHLPYIAINSGQILQNSLRISDSQHKQKIQLRAMDVILFGPPVHYQGYIWKDIILVICVAWCLSGIVYAFRQRRLFQSRMDSFIADLRLKEEEVDRLKSRFEELDQEDGDVTDGGSGVKEGNGGEEEDSPIMMTATEGRGSPTASVDEYGSKNLTPLPQDIDSVFSLTQAQEKIDILQDDLWSMERELESKDSVIQSLRQILPECQQKERHHLEFRKTLGEDQITRAQRACEKIRKRRSSLFGTFHLANSSALEEAGLQITKAVNKMQYISECFEEHHKRWSKIGQMTGFPHSPRDLTPMGMDQPPVFAIPPRRYSVRRPDPYNMVSTISTRSRSFRQSRYSRNSAGSMSNGSRNSDPFGIPPNQLPSLEERRESENGQTSKDSAFVSDTTSVQESAMASPPSPPRASVSSRSISRSNSNPTTSHSCAFQQPAVELAREERSASESGQDSIATTSCPDKSSFRKIRSRERVKKRPGIAEPVAQLIKDTCSEDSTDSSTRSLPPQFTRGSCRSLNKVSLSSEV